MRCPLWDPEARDPLAAELDVDWRVRYLWNRQHPMDCSRENYLIKTTHDMNGFGSLISGHYAGPFAGALRSNR